MAGLLTPRVLDKIGAILQKRILDRTSKGIDWSGRKFRPYTPAYAKWKGVPQSAVNLRLSGRMLKDFYVKVDLKPEYRDTDVFYIDVGMFVIHWGFRTGDSIEKYYWNADNQYGYNRDFIGAVQGTPLLSAKELNEIIQQALRS